MGEAPPAGLVVSLEHREVDHPAKRQHPRIRQPQLPAQRGALLTEHAAAAARGPTAHSTASPGTAPRPPRPAPPPRRRELPGEGPPRLPAEGPAAARPPATPARAAESLNSSNHRRGRPAASGARRTRMTCPAPGRPEHRQLGPAAERGRSRRRSPGRSGGPACPCRSGRWPRRSAAAETSAGARLAEHSPTIRAISSSTSANTSSWVAKAISRSIW